MSKERKEMTFAEKIELLDKIDSLPQHFSQRQIAASLGVPKSTIGRIINKQEELREAWASSKSHSTAKRKKRKGKDLDVGEALKEWFFDATEQGVCINRRILKSKAEEFAQQLGRSNFRATDFWLSRWKNRYEIKYRTQVKNGIDDSIINYWKSETVMNLLRQFSSDDIYYAEETRLFYHCMVDNSVVKQNSSVDSENDVDYVTVLCCTNVSGSDKQKPLVLGKELTPLSFEGFGFDSWPVVYSSNGNAQMSPEIFTDWLNKWNAELQLGARKVLLLVDDTHLPCDFNENSCSSMNIRTEFYPCYFSSFTSIGLISKLKEAYQKKLFGEKSSAVEKLNECVNISQVIECIADCWSDIDSKTIQKCFTHVFQPSDVENNDMSLFKMESSQGVSNVEDFLCVDLQCYDEDSHENTVDFVKSELCKESKNLSNDRSDASVSDRVDQKEAMSCLLKLRHYFSQKGNENSPISALEQCYEFVHSKSLESDQS